MSGNSHFKTSYYQWARKFEIVPSFCMKKSSFCERNVRLCVKAVTEPDSAESTEMTDRARTESTKYNGKLRFSDTGI